jgi:tetratricopeptide (TPR) repeat protein
MVDRTRLVTLTWRCDAGHDTRAPGWGVIEDWGAVCELAHAVLAPDGRTEELRARAGYRLGVALANLDEDDAAIAAYDGAIESLTHSQPLEAVRAAQNLAAILSDRDDWAGAAERFRIAIRTADTRRDAGDMGGGDIAWKNLELCARALRALRLRFGLFDAS